MQSAPLESVPNYLVQSILITLCCCLPLGVVALIYASQVNGKLAAGDIEGARASSRLARNWGVAAFILGIVANLSVVMVSFLSK